MSVPVGDWSAVWDILGSEVTVSDITSVLAIVLPAAIALALAWWGIRKVTEVLMNAFRKGRIGM